MNIPLGNLIEVNEENGDVHAEGDGNIVKGKKNFVNLCKTKFDHHYPQNVWHRVF